MNSKNEPSPKHTKNYIGFAKIASKNTSDTYHFFIFPDNETGRAQLIASLKRKYAEKTIPQLATKYAPPGDNDTARYTRDLLKEAGIPADKLIGTLTDSELAQLADGIAKIEGYHGDASSRREVWVPVSNVTATDGAGPLADEEIILRTKGGETTLKSNQYGQFPPIPHPKEAVEVVHKQADGKEKPVGTLSGAQGQHFSLTTLLQRFIGTSAPDAATTKTTDRKQFVRYTVQPNDSLSKIAKKFNTTVAAIKLDNKLTRDTIFPGQTLGINGPPKAADRAAATPKRSAPKSDPLKRKAAPPADHKATPARSKSGGAQPLALIKAEPILAPWMAIAFREAIEFAGKREEEITKVHNYHRLVRDSDRAGGRDVVVKGKDGKPQVGNDGKVITRKDFGDSYPSLVGGNRPWCASFVNYCLREAGYAPGRRHMSTYTFGEDKDLFLRVKEPVFGAIRFSRRDGGGHVCFVYGTIGNKLVVIGGNQGDRICFELRDPQEKNSVYFVPLAYKEYSEKREGSVVPEIDIDSLRREFDGAIKISDQQIDSTAVKKGTEG